MAARVVVSVAFSRVEFEQIAREAERQGKKVSALVRERALRRTLPPPVVTVGGLRCDWWPDGAWVWPTTTGAGASWL